MIVFKVWSHNLAIGTALAWLENQYTKQVLVVSWISLIVDNFIIEFIFVESFNAFMMNSVVHSFDIEIDVVTLYSLEEIQSRYDQK